MATEPCGGAVLYTRDNRIEVGDRRRGRRMEQHATVRVAREYAVQDGTVEVNVEIHR